MNNYFKLIRVEQWVKNTLLFAPLFFGQKIFHASLLLETLVGVIAFSFTASAVYIINDIFDRKSDALHPKKKFRPLAAGLITTKNAILFAILLLSLALFLTFLLPTKFSFVLLGYVILNLAYSYKLKHIPIIDIFVLSFNYLARLFAGAFITGIPLSQWLVLMTLLLSLFIALAKRRDDVILFNEHGNRTRKVIDGYNLIFLDSTISIMGGVVIVFYTMYCLSPSVVVQFKSNYLYLTVIFVIMGLFRYMQIAMVEKNAGAPTDLLLRDRFIQIVVFLWLLSFFFFLYSPFNLDF